MVVTKGEKMKLRKNYVEFKLNNFTSMVVGFMKLLEENPQLLNCVEDPKMLVRLDRENRLEMGYIEDFVVVK